MSEVRMWAVITPTGKLLARTVNRYKRRAKEAASSQWGWGRLEEGGFRCVRVRVIEEAAE